MNVLLLVIVPPLLYVLLGTTFSILLTILPTENLKLKIVLLTFLRPIAFTILLSLILPSFFEDSWIWLAGFTLAVVLRDIILSTQKVLVKLTVQHDAISILYINTFLQTKHWDVSFTKASELQLSNMNTIAEYPASLKIVDIESPKRFIILSKKTWAESDESLKTANVQSNALRFE